MRARGWACAGLLGVAAIGTAFAAAASDADAERAFLTACDAAMAAMHAGMAIRPSGDVDADFAAMMIPLHRGAIDMAAQELRYGRNEQLRRIAQEIVVDQQQEIVAMSAAVGRPPPAASASDQTAAMAHRHEPGVPQ